MNKDGILNDGDFHALCVEIAGKMNGLSVSQVEHVFGTVSNMVKAGSLFSTDHRAYAQPAQELLDAKSGMSKQ